jgi:hypothetical protein
LTFLQDIYVTVNLIAEINLIAKEEGVYHCDYEAKCDTHISGIVSLRHDYMKGGQYKAAEDFTPEDLEEQNKLPIIQQLATPDTHEEKKHEPSSVHRCIINKTKLHDFYLEVKVSMTKTSRNGEKGATYNHFDEIFQRERLTQNETKQSLKLLLKIILQCNDSKYFLTTTSGGRALKLLNSENFSLLKQIITPEKRDLNYEDLARFAREENDKKPLSFFATKNKEANMTAFNTEINQLKDLQKSHLRLVT